MNLKGKWYLGFTIVFWLLIIGSIILFSFAFEKVPINSYGIKRNYFDSRIEQQFYPSGLYYKAVGFYFIKFPSSKKYVEDIQLNVTNRDMQTIGIKYTLAYRLFPAKIYDLYGQFSQQYESRIITIVNSIVSNYFAKLEQKDTRVSAQSGIVSEIQTQFGVKIPILATAIQVQSFWLNQLDFYENEVQYQFAFRDANSYSQAYEQSQIQYQKTKLKVETLKNLLEISRQQLQMLTEQQIILGITNTTKQSLFKKAQRKYLLSQGWNVSQIFEYYSPPRINFQ